MIRSVTPQGIVWLASKVKLPITAEFKGMEGYDSKGNLIGVLVYDKWTYNSVRIHMALNGRPSKELLHAAFEYPFVQSEKGVLLAEIPASRPVALKIALGVGFKQIARVKDGWAIDDDLIILEMRREQWRAKKGA